MRMLLAGATGAIGQRLLPQILAAGHEVTATTRNPAKANRLQELGVEPAVVDGLDRDAIGKAVARAEPDAIVHQMTALAAKPNLRRFDRWFATTNELRTEGTDIRRFRRRRSRGSCCAMATSTGRGHPTNSWS